MEDFALDSDTPYLGYELSTFCIVSFSSSGSLVIVGSADSGRTGVELVALRLCCRIATVFFFNWTNMSRCIAPLLTLKTLFVIVPVCILQDIYLLRYDGLVEDLQFSPDEVEDVKLVHMDQLKEVLSSLVSILVSFQRDCPSLRHHGIHSTKVPGTPELIHSHSSFPITCMYVVLLRLDQLSFLRVYQVFNAVHAKPVQNQSHPFLFNDRV